MNKSEIIAQAAEYLDVFTSKMEKMPDTASVKRLVAELCAIAASAGDAPAVQGEPVAFCEDAALSIAERTFSTEVDEQLSSDIIQYAQRLYSLYTAPQPAEQQPDVTQLVEALEEGLRAIGDHHAPGDCYATGPMTGDPFRDLVQCPACSFIAMCDDLLAAYREGGESDE